MSARTKLWMGAVFLGALAIISCSVSVNTGGDGTDPSVTFQVANLTFTLTLGAAGSFPVEPDVRVSNVVDVRQQLFERAPTDTPGSGSIRLRSSTVQIIEPTNEKTAVAQQSIEGTAGVTLLIDDGGAADPCATGVTIGSFNLTVSGGVVTSLDQSLSLSPTALTLVLSNDFSLCLQMEANFTATINLGGIDFVFGPAIDDNTNENGNDNVDGNTNDNTVDNTNDNVDDNVNTNDNVDDNANANDNGNTNDNVSPLEGFTPATIRHRGSEQIVAGPNVDPAQSAQTQAGYAPTDIALSGDGQKVWFVLYDEFPNVAGDPYIRLWAVNTDGTGGTESALSASDLRGIPVVATNRDGSVAIIESGFSSSAVLRASPGSAATLLVDTALLGSGGCARASARLTDDGGAFFYRDYCGQQFFRVAVASPTPTLIVRADQIVNAAGIAARGINEFDITADGGQWWLEPEFLDSAAGNILYYNVVSGASVGPSVAFETLPFDTRLIRNVQVRDDGNTIAYCIGGAALGDVGNCYVQTAGTTSLTAITDDRSALGDMAFADDGSRVYVRTYYQFSGGCSYIQEVATGERIAAGSQRFADGACPAFGSAQFSDDGDVLASATTRGVYVLHDGVDGLPGFPTIANLSYRYDGDEFLVVRATVTAPTGVERIFVLPFYSTGLDPTERIPEDENPFFNERSGGGVNWSTTFAEVAGSPGIWERTLDLCNSAALCKRNFITSEYRLRIIVVDATGTRTTFQDFTPIP